MSYERDEILEILEETPDLTATAIAKALGRTKASKSLKNDLEEMADQGVLEEDTSGRYVRYSIGDEEVEEAQAPQEATIEPGAGQTEVPSLPVEDVEGYSVTGFSNGKVSIECPGGDTVSLETGEYLLVINGTPTWAVKTAEDVLTCISAYANEKGLATYVVSNTASGKIVGGKDDIELKDNRILTLDIKRHNKAA